MTTPENPEPTTAEVLAETQKILDTLLVGYEAARQTQVQSGWFPEPKRWVVPTQREILLQKLRDRWNGRSLA